MRRVQTAEPVDTPPSDFRRLAEETIYQGHVIRVVRADFAGPAGERFRRDVVRSPGAVAVVPVLVGPDGPETLLVRQYRPAIDRWLTEIPAGLRDKPGEDPLDTAVRELIEETGFMARRCTLLTTFLNAAGMTDQQTHIYLAEDLEEVGRAGDGVEEAYLEVLRVPFAAVRPMIDRQELADAKTVIGLLLALGHLGL